MGRCLATREYRALERGVCGVVALDAPLDPRTHELQKPRRMEGTMPGLFARIVALIAPWVGLGYLIHVKEYHGGSVIVAMFLCIVWDIFVADNFPMPRNGTQEA